MDVVGHNDPMIYRNGSIVLRDVQDRLLCQKANARKRDVFRAINDRPYILPKEVSAGLGADRDKIGIGSAVIIFCALICCKITDKVRKIEINRC
jgi:hypothetical protein